MKAAQISGFGKPQDVCQCIEVAEPAEPAGGELIVEMEACPIIPADLALIEGRYASPEHVPITIGFEGCGRVIAIGSNVARLAAGDRIVSLGRNNWAQRIKIPADLAFKVPTHGDAMQQSMLKVTPTTAHLLLRESALKSNEWLIQNAANSAVGRHVIRMAREHGIKTINVVRRPAVVEELKALGADVVVADGSSLTDEVKRASAGARIAVAFDAVGGDATRRLAHCLSNGATVITYGLLRSEPCHLGTDQLIVRDIRLKGFWLTRARNNMTRNQVLDLYEDLSTSIVEGRLEVPVEATYDLEHIHDALHHAAHERRSGKILLLPNGSVR